MIDLTAHDRPEIGSSAPASHRSEAAASLAGIRVLIVDDDLVQAEALGALLSDEAIEATPVATAAEALASTAGRKADAVVLDLVMPDMNGVQLLARLREQTPRLPAILTTGWPYDQRVAAFLDASETAYLTKPVDVSRLIALLAELVAPARRPGAGR